MKKRSRSRVLRAAALASAVLLGACVGDADELTQPVEPATGGALFQRYVSLGNSITAGYQSGGINDSTQLRAYPVLLAGKANAEFTSPLVPRPGCPRPYISPLGLAGRLGGGAADTCFRINNPRITNNMAVPGEKIGDLLSFPTDPSVGRLHTLLMGPRTQLQAMADARPTLVSAWIGNNDALAAGLGGNLAALTPTALFAARADSVLSAIDAANPMDAIIIGVVDPTIVPLLQPGAFFYVAYSGSIAAGQPSPFGRPVNVNCAPGTPGGSRAISFQLLSTPVTGAGSIPEISCATEAPFVLDAAEQATLTASVTAFNAALRTGATNRGFLFVDPADVLNRYRANPARIRKCQGFATATTPAQFSTAIANTCPALTNPAVGFGNLFSFDGVHPSSAAHVIFADYLAGLINTRAGLSLPAAAIPAS